MFLETWVVVLMKNCFIQIYGCNIVRFSLHRCKWRHYGTCLYCDYFHLGISSIVYVL